MVKNRRKRLGERLRRCLEVEVTNEEEEDGVAEEGEDGNSKGEDVSEEEEENEAGEKRSEGNKETEAEEIDKEEEEGESDLEKRLQERIKTKNNREMIEGDNQVDVQEGEKDEEEEVKENGEVQEEEEIRKADDVMKGEEDWGDEEESELKGNDKVDLEEEGNDSTGEVEENEDSQIEVRQIGEVRQLQEDDDEEEEHQEQNGGFHLEVLTEQTSEDVSVENIWENQEHGAQEDVKWEEKDNFSDSVESMNREDVETEFLHEYEDEYQHDEDQYEDSDEQEDPDKNSLRHENVSSEAWTVQDRNEEEDGNEKLTDDEGTVINSRKELGSSWETPEEFHDDHENLQEETEDDKEAECSMDEDEDNDYEDEVKVYCKDNYPTKLFHTLNEFKDSALLTDLTLSTEDGKSCRVHSPVLAAVSSLIWKNRSGSKVENGRRNERNYADTSVGVHGWSVSFGLEVDHDGLEAVVEFAYTGTISRLNKDNVEQVKAAAQILGAPRVLDLCAKEEELLAKTYGFSARQQLMISLQSIKQLWMDGVGCDVILETPSGSLHVHRVILAVSSDYFRGMFTLGMKESHQPCVSLPFLMASELEALICSSYSGALPISWTSVFEITATALQLQYQPALSLGLNFLQQEMNHHTCLDVVSFAEAYEIANLLEVADDFVLRQFQKVACTSKFKDLPAKQVFKYLYSHSLCVPSELVVFNAVVAWIQAKPNRRLRLAKQLMKTVHFPLMTFKDFKEVQSHNIWSDPSLTELYEAVFENFCSNETALQSQCRIYLPKESLVLIGGDQISEDLGSRSISTELWFGNSLRNHTGIKKAMEWRRLGEMPEPARFNHEVAVLNGQLYVLGGKKYYGIHDTLNSVYRYDPHQNSWESLSEMQENRCSFSVVVLDGKIYAISGHRDPDRIESVESYCPTTNSWSFTWPLDLPLSGHVAKVLQGQIFISGGQNSDYLCLASMLLYQPDTGSTYLANMTKPRANHCMEILGECLYVAGGITTYDGVTVTDQLACEVYSPAEDSWTAFTSLPVPHVGAGSAVWEGKFYVLGGYSHEDYSDTKMVHRYDAITQKWENMGKMPGPNNDLRASVLCLPPHFRL